MLNRKYIFETKSTRIRRVVLSSLLLLVATMAILTTFVVYLPISARIEKEKTSGAFFQKSPDAIVVFTGDKGRINYALDIVKKNPSSKLLISGVYASNSIETLIQNQSTHFPQEELLGTQVDIDYESKNTFQNVKETVSFIKSNPNINNVLIISSDYHILRIKFILGHFLPGKTPQFYFDSVSLDYSKWNNVRKLLKEAVKLIRTFILIKVMDEEIVIE